MSQIRVAREASLSHEGMHASSFLSGSSLIPTNDTTTVRRMSEVARLVRKLALPSASGKDDKKVDAMTWQAYQIIMEIAAQPGISLTELEKHTGISLASVSRNTDALGDMHRLRKPGLGLVEKIDDPVERRRKIVFLTAKGREFVSDILSALKGERVHFEAPTAKEHLSRSYSSNIRR